MDYSKNWNVRDMVLQGIWIHGNKMEAIKNSDLNAMTRHAGEAQLQSHYKTIGDQLFNTAGNIG